MEYPEFKRIIEPIFGNPIEGKQEEIIQHLDDPLWVIAGPGSGKTEVLVLRTLKLIFVDDVSPKSIIITTFTRKAAKNLMDRILNYLPVIYARFPELERTIDIHQLRIGTLHSLCTDIMQEYKFPQFENVRLMDDFEQLFFIYDHSIIFSRSDKERFAPLLDHFNYLWGNFSNKFTHAKAVAKIFNRISEDRINLAQLNTANQPMPLLVEAYEDYLLKMDTHGRIDYANLQQKFLIFLNSELGHFFINGNESIITPGIKYVMVDEYQDTNPIQEQIYLKLCESSHNLCIVGDDDQALYRFRGGSVDCMVTFDQACSRFWGVDRQTIIHNKKFLSKNYRSHSHIVSFFDNYIRVFPEMNVQGARTSGKPALDSNSSITGTYPALGYIMGRTIDISAQNFAIFVRSLLDNQIIQDPSQCVLLMRSVRDNSRNAGPFMTALADQNIPSYNPRSKSFMDQEEIQLAIGALIKIIDPQSSALNTLNSPQLQNKIQNWLGFYDNFVVTPSGHDLNHYVNKSIQRIDQDFPPSTWLNISILEIFYRILAHAPFRQWQEDPEKTYRLGKLTKIIESYSSIPIPGHVGSNRGQLKRSARPNEGISFLWRQQFYFELIRFLVNEGMNDPEDEEIICPCGRLPIMTVHQAKGLEFPFVFVFGLDDTPRVDSTIRLEEELIPYRIVPSFVNLTPVQKAAQDLIRFYFVAYSRPQYALIHIIPLRHRKKSYGYANQDYVNYFRIMNDSGGVLYDRASLPRTS
ncbi:MAG: ATP-dependent helicase [Methanoregula sp.]